ncbi:MAG TPA: hypothetical protein VFX51_27605 [Solirubrobacteraceae bacterium]|nr:hypothetical protein [Solirubrobacteraceae bacterium]
MLDVFLGTTSGVLWLHDGALEPSGLDGRNVSALHVSDDVLLAGTYGDGLFRSSDRGRTWERIEAGLTASTFRFVTAELAGTEPARVFRSSDGGRCWTELDGITRIPGHERWFLPYSPRAGAARNAHVAGDRLLVAAEVAGLLRSDDGGDTWVCEPVVGDEDVHHVTGHPDDPDHLYVSLGTASLTQHGGRHGGVARSRDGGRTWDKIETDYTRATIVPPARSDLLLAGPAPRVGRGGRIVVSRDGGDTWEAAADGIDVPMPDMVELFVAAPDGSVWAICSGGRLLHAAPDDWTWASALPPDSGVSVKSVGFA